MLSTVLQGKPRDTTWLLAEPFLPSWGDASIWGDALTWGDAPIWEGCFHPGDAPTALRQHTAAHTPSSSRAQLGVQSVGVAGREISA